MGIPNRDVEASDDAVGLGCYPEQASNTNIG